MIKNSEPKIASTSAASIVFFLSKGTFLGIGTYVIFKIAKTSAYISMILAFLIGIIPFAMNMYILKHTKGNNIIDTIDIAFGKKLGFIMNLIFSIFFFAFATVLIYNFISFIDINYMPETSKLYIAVFMIIILAYMMSKGLNAIANASQMFLFVSIIILLLTIFGMISSIDVNNLMPAFESPKLQILRGATTAIGLSILPTFLINLIGTNIVDDKNKYIKSCYKMYGLVALELIVLFTLCLSALGINLISINKYPEYLALTKVNILNLVKRVQNIIAVQLSYNVIILVVMSLMYPFKNIERYIKKEKKKPLVYFGISISSVVLSLYIFPNMTKANLFYIEYFPIVLGAFLGFFLLVIFFRIMYIEKKKKTLNNTFDSDSVETR